jgi:hypothetical protein
MSQDSERNEQMRPEYDFRGAVRGKYLDWYRREVEGVAAVVLDDSPLISHLSTDAPPEIADVVNSPMSYLPPSPSPAVEVEFSELIETAASAQ